MTDDNIYLLVARRLECAQQLFPAKFYLQQVTKHRTTQSSDASETVVLGKNPTLADLLDYRISRRDTFKIGLVATAVVATAVVAAPSIFKTSTADAAIKLTPQIPGLPGVAKKPAESAGFTGIAPAAITDDAFRVPAGYETQVILRWGDPLVPGAPAFDVNKQTGDAQSKQVGFNHDYQHFFADDETGTKGVLVINHEYTTAAQMIPGYNANTTDLAFPRRGSTSNWPPTAHRLPNCPELHQASGKCSQENATPESRGRRPWSCLAQLRKMSV